MTNQSELVETILSILGVTDRTSGNRPEQIATLEQEIVSYITTDRKRVALEARIELIDSMLNSSPGILHDCGRRLDGVFGKTYLEYRKSELKAQQEEV